jgi:hypothetical protein
MKSPKASRRIKINRINRRGMKKNEKLVKLLRVLSLWNARRPINSTNVRERVPRGRQGPEIALRFRDLLCGWRVSSLGISPLPIRSHIGAP